MGKLDEIISEIGSKYYPVGSVVITSTNVGTTYMNTLYGGEWTLVRKRFAEKTVTDAFTFNTTNTQNGASVCELYKNSILCRIAYYPKVAFADTSLAIATLDCTKLGITASNHIYTQHHLAVSDGLNAMNWVQINGTGATSIEICTKTNATSVAANSSYGWIASFALSFSGAPSSMIDSFCDEFWWVREA